jgi:Histidine kinase-, DNA gyrase B-, and HSP90-like ATPase
MNDGQEPFPPGEPAAPTWFAPGERALPEDFAELARRTVENPIFQAVLESTEGLVMVLDEHRQVLAANDELLEALDLPAEGAVLGLRPGEVLDCTHVEEGPSGCGTSKACSKCGAILAILAAHTHQHPAEDECYLSFHRKGRLEAVEFRVRATPMLVGDHRLTVLVLVDISAQKRREVLESLFHHDVSNTLQGLWACGELIQRATTDPKEAGRRILDLSLRLKQELDCHRTLMAAEAGTFEVNPERLEVKDIFGRIEALFADRPVARLRNLAIRSPEGDANLRSDQELLMRILENMVTNALEATPPGARVEVWFTDADGQTRFHVRNPGVLPEEVALRIFQRSFSTKGSKGRGLGTYGMKLFGETYLGGQVSFTSRVDEGITFTLSLPTAVD